MGFWTPARRRGHEILDDPQTDAETRIRSLGDVTRSNALFGGRRAAVHAATAAIERGASVTLLDVGTGLADIPAAIADAASKRGATVTAFGLDEAADLLSRSRSRLAGAVCGDASALPFRDSSFDIVVCSQLLHHFSTDDVPSIVRELDRVARSLVVISDIRRSWIAAAGFWLASFPLGFHPVTRHDGVVSVFRGFTAGELRAAVESAAGTVPTVKRRPGFRVTATWSPRTA